MGFRQFKINNPQEKELWKQKTYALCRHFEVSCCLDSNNRPPSAFVEKGYEFLAGLGAKRIFQVQSDDPFEELERFHNRSLLFGYFGYDLKNKIEKLSSANPDYSGFPNIFFFEPQFLVRIEENQISIQGEDVEHFVNNLNSIKPADARDFQMNRMQCRMQKQDYLEKVENIRQRIAEGDVYELNLCVEFFAEKVKIDPLHAYLHLRKSSPTPFGAYLNFNDYYLACTSPERFLKKEKNRLISQPIKGTAKRTGDPITDKALAEHLFASEKERAENVMIVDLVRNDLAKSCEPGSVKVDELFGIYSFPKVHQMISTVSGTLRPDCTWSRSIKNAFPMGSMTGAPKVMAMKLIDEIEDCKRSVYSGALGYITPESDFDFNVIIRSLVYNKSNSYLSYQAGGAITYDSDPENEWEEIMLKSEGIAPC